VKTDFHRAGEGDEVNLRLTPWNSVCGAVSRPKLEYSTGRGDEAFADFRAAPSDEVENARREAGLDAQAHQFRRDDGRVVRRLEQDGVAARDGGAGCVRRRESVVSSL